MTKFITTPKIECSATITINEEEMRALEALTGYSDKSFLEWFYNNMGTTYLKPHEAGLLSLFKSVRDEIPYILSKTNKARKVFEE